MVKSIKLGKSEWKEFLLKFHDFGVTDSKDMQSGSSYTIEKSGDKVSLNVYEKLNEVTLVVQGKDSKLAQNIISALEGCIHTLSQNEIGVDESGKGDLFGPLVVGGVYAESSVQPKLVALGVKDSKKLSDKKITELAAEIKKLCLVELVVIGPTTYNRLYEKLKNVNKLLAWGHSRVIENLLSSPSVNCDKIVIDQFSANKSRVENVLMERGKKALLEQRHKGEANVVVAAASIVARAEFVNQLSGLASKYDMSFSKGVSAKVKEERLKFIEKYGQERLSEVAKLHFQLA